MTLSRLTGKKGNEMKKLFVIVAILLIFTALSSIIAVETHGQTDTATLQNLSMCKLEYTSLASNRSTLQTATIN